MPTKVIVPGKTAQEYVQEKVTDLAKEKILISISRSGRFLMDVIQISVVFHPVVQATCWSISQ